MEIYTIGFTRWSASDFFDALINANISRLVDVRLKNDSQLAGFTRKRDLPYFLKELANATYTHETLLAPTDDLLSGYRAKRLPWDMYEAKYLELLDERDVAQAIDRAGFDEPSVLLCSEHEPTRCHRRIAADYLARAWGSDVAVTHIS